MNVKIPIQLRLQLPPQLQVLVLPLAFFFWGGGDWAILCLLLIFGRYMYLKLKSAPSFFLMFFTSGKMSFF